MSREYPSTEYDMPAKHDFETGKPKRESQVSLAIAALEADCDALAKMLSELESRVPMLETRLQQVGNFTRVEDATQARDVRETRDDPKPLKVYVPLAEIIHKRRESVMRATQRVSAVCDLLTFIESRIEL